MKTWLVAVVLLAGGLARAEAPRVSVVDVAAKAGALAAQVKREAQAAKARGLVAVVEVTADWCKPCVAIKKFLGDPLMVDAFRGVHLIRVGLDDWKDDELRAAGLAVRGVPTFLAVDATGRPTGRTITSSVWGDDIPANMAPPLKRFFASLR